MAVSPSRIEVVEYLSLDPDIIYTNSYFNQWTILIKKNDDQ